MRAVRVVGVLGATVIGLGAGAFAAGAVGPPGASSPRPLQAADCPSGKIVIGDPTYASELTGASSDENPADQQSLSVKPDLNPKSVKVTTPAPVASATDPAARWMAARGYATARGAAVSSARALDADHRVIEITRSDRPAQAQLVLEREGAGWRIGAIRECAP